MKELPFSFVLEQLERAAPYTKPMFGAWSVYVGEKTVFILCDNKKYPHDRGVWLATFGEHHESLREELPSMRSLVVFGPGPTAWQNIPADGDGFEEEVIRACELVLGGDPRIGKIPKRERLSAGSTKKSKKKAPAKKKSTSKKRKK